MIDAHVHLDRARTADDGCWKHTGRSVREVRESSLALKQQAVGDLHNGPAYKPDELYARMQGILEEKITGEKEVWACTDTSPDIGLVAFDAALKLRAELAPELDLKVGAYPIFGFKTVGSDRYELICEAAKRAQFLVGLPERDCAPEHTVGFDGHLQLLFKIAHENHLPMQIHVDQANDPQECGTETLIDAVRWLGAPKIEGISGPTVWAVHVISPSAYDETRFSRLVENLVKYKIGVIVCPHAAISMRQLRPISAPTHNSIARVRELIVAGVPLRLGTDNIEDIFVPLPRRVDLARELERVYNDTRFYEEDIWNKIAHGEELNNIDREFARRSLAEDQRVFAAI
ncbi:MAG: hypothetical protein NTZ65_04805 [Candidatus Berkelbacteria bacterium]|nr:hypothetical protein [Candidatus Berkelbacteria bacterium]